MLLTDDDEFEGLTDERSLVSIPATAVVDAKPQWVLKKLTSKHRKIIQLKVAGLTRVDVGREAGCTPEYVSMLLRQDVAKAYLQTMYEDLDQDLKDLVAPAIDTVRELLGSGDDKVALAAANLALKANGKMERESIEDRPSAEDFVSKIFQFHNSNVQINLTQGE